MSDFENDSIIIPAETVSQPRKDMMGHVRIWATDNDSGKYKLVVDKSNLILYSGATVMSNALAGTPNSAVTGFYVSYCNSSSFTAPVIDLPNSNPITAYTAPFGFLRLALAYNPSFSSQTNYLNNTVIFTTQVASATSSGGAAFTSGVSNIFECALVAIPNFSSIASDTVFSRINFNPILFNSSQSLTIAWSVSFICS